MNKTILTALTLCVLLACEESGNAGLEEPIREAWVTSDRLNRRTCPSESCGVVGVLLYRENADIYEEASGWARVSKHYDAACEQGKSDYVDSGNDGCVAANGIVDGTFAEWVSLQYLDSVRPDDPSAGATGNHALISGSDDYRIYKDAFAKAAADLIASGRCTRADFEEMGGWYKSSFHRNEPVYFTYCGEAHIENRLYLNASTGRVFQ